MNDNWQYEDETALDALRWRDEILQIMFWLIGEGMVDEPSADDVQRFLGLDDIDTIQFYLDALAEEGFLVQCSDAADGLRGHRYSLSDMGRREGGRRFADEFANMTKPAHGECSADCDCHQTGHYGSCSDHL
ncbi:MAG: hypothetical protein ETSY1_23115 [Candidatus Entotheonella factor]|uniref:Uncharacterized protein n=1 Tax=Entotheonella factor TaxID=1429438 RepID=W4LI01_ENTF1|nr:hypothetical protein [Candidatus Entotheonella palauensis]ETW97320.1 MAG: hypothetical protein ETSY1_23115 [Candidatus Entotheonella factor]